jgi:hypothetical protein
MPSFPFFRERPQKLEWIGGRYTFPLEVQDGKDVVRPGVILWMEMPDRVLVGSRAFDPRTPAPLVETLDEAMLRPNEGPSRRPFRIRVPEEAMAAELRRAFRGIPIVVAPVSELDEIFDALSDAAKREANPSYLRGGATPAVVGEFFAAAIALFRSAPWRRINERQLVRVDIPAFDINNACLSVIGGAGETFGLLLFRSIDDFHSFAMRLTPDIDDAGDDAVVRSVSFDRKKDLPPSLTREIREHGWPVAGSKAYPTLICLDGAMNPLEATEVDFRIVTAVTRAFVSFYEKHHGVFDTEEAKTVCEIFEADDDVTVTLTAPYGLVEDIEIALTDEEDSLFDDDPFVEPRLLITRTVGRNDPCPCGSGKKYKKCHLDADRG